jgi:CPA1 family monovalent cation:H+ antiporter
MLVAGVVVAFLPGMPTIAPEPDLVLLAFLPPLIYAAGVGMSWRGFRSNLRPILLLAIGLVLFSASAVAGVVHYVFGLAWPVGFALGAVVSPPDSIAPVAVLRPMGLPKRLLTILEGESLVNDATALVTLSFAVEAVATGTFSPSAAAARFVAIVVGEVAFGIAVGHLMLRLRNVVAEPRAEVLLALATPYLAFWPPYELGGSGVVACVATGLYVSWNGRNYIRSDTRLQGYFIWDLVNWCVEALAFFITGLETRAIVTNLSSDGWPTLLAAGLLVSVTVIIVRFVWVFPVTYLPRLLWPPIRKREPTPSWRPPFLVGFAGLRGAVSLAAALSIPLALNGQPFPHRDLILFATISVIVATLVVQGAALPSVVAWLGLGHIGRREANVNRRAESLARIAGIEAVLAALEAAEKEAATPPEAIEALRRLHRERRANFLLGAERKAAEEEIADIEALQLRLVEAERNAIADAYEANKITDEARRRIEREFDLEEASLRHALAGRNG